MQATMYLKLQTNPPPVLAYLKKNKQKKNKQTKTTKNNIVNNSDQ